MASPHHAGEQICQGWRLVGGSWAYLAANLCRQWSRSRGTRYESAISSSLQMPSRPPCSWGLTSNFLRRASASSLCRRRKLQGEQMRTRDFELNHICSWVDTCISSKSDSAAGTQWWDIGRLQKWEARTQGLSWKTRLVISEYTWSA